MTEGNKVQSTTPHICQSSIFRSLVHPQEISNFIEEIVGRALTNPEALYLLVHRYTHFNGYAGPLVGILAANIGLSRELFHDPHEEIRSLADRASLVARYVHNATIDEHGMGISNKKLPHRVLAQGTLKFIAEFAKLNGSRQNKLSQAPSWLSEICQRFISGYQGKAGDIEELLLAMGFHAASEMLADIEYAAIDRALRINGKDSSFARYLQTRTRVVVGDYQINPYIWITAHACHDRHGVEHDHYEDALRAIEMAEHYSSVDPKEFLNWIKKGFQKFITLQHLLFSFIREEITENYSYSFPLEEIVTLPSIQVRGDAQ